MDKPLLELLSKTLAVVERGERDRMLLSELKQALRETFQEHASGMPFRHSPGHPPREA